LRPVLKKVRAKMGRSVIETFFSNVRK
jgi:hypothetical protein